MAKRRMADTSGDTLAWFVMLATPLFFSSNLVFGRWTVPEVAPATLAFLRWAAVGALLLPFSWPHLRDRTVPLRPVIVLAFLGMVVCGAVVYLALGSTSATNATLIYTSSPIFVLLMERMRGRPLGIGRLVGCTVAMAGVAIILFRGDLGRAAALELRAADLLMVGCAVAWAAYSIVFRDPRLRAVPAAGLFGAIALMGAAMLAPFAGLELAAGMDMPATSRAWTGIAGIVVFSSLIAFGGYQFGLRRFGASRTSVFMYLLPVYGVALAATFLGEPFRGFHVWGIALVLGGVVLATRPNRDDA